MIWDVGGGTQTVDVSVSTDIESLREQFKTILPDTDIQMSSVNGTIALRGRVGIPQHGRGITLLESAQVLGREVGEAARAEHPLGP